MHVRVHVQELNKKVNYAVVVDGACTGVKHVHVRVSKLRCTGMGP